MTEQEKALLANLGKCYNEFAALPQKDATVMNDVCMHIHALQCIVMARTTARLYPEFFNSPDVRGVE